MRRKMFPAVLVLCCIATVSTVVHSQEGRIFLPTPDTVAIYEFNGLSTLPDGSPIPTGTTIPDLSGNGLTATVEGNESNDLSVSAGDPNFGVENRECRRSQFAGAHTPRIAVNDDGDAFEMEPGDDFSIELYVNRETVEGSANWGILAGTWHSRNVLVDTDNPDNLGAWYGYGLIRNDFAANPGAGGEWSWVFSPVVDGVPRIGFPQTPEVPLQPYFAIPQGRHYVVVTVNRIDQMATGYVDGVQVASLFLDPTWSFMTPDGYEHARFMMFAGEDDPTRGAFRGSPAGTHLDAVRFQRRALSADDVLQSWGDIESGVPTPPTGDVIRAVVSASPVTAIVGQCVVLDTAGSSPGAGQTITRYEWRVGAAGVFEDGAATREVSFNAPDAAGIPVTVRITNSASATSQASVSIRVNEAPVAARIVASVGGFPVQGRTIFVPVGSVVTLDGTSSFTQVPATALVCPLSAATPVPPPAIAGYAWDLDENALTVESTEPVFDTPAFDTPGEFPVSLRVRNERNVSGTAAIVVKVVEAGTGSTIFHNTEATLVHFEFNDGFDGLNDGDPVPTGTIVEDLSPNGLDAVVEANDTGGITVNTGALVYDNPAGANRELRRATDGNDPRIAINDDGDLFEMSEVDDFTVELYVSRETTEGGANWGILAGTWHSRNVLDDLAVPDQAGAWYGFGLIRNDKLANPPAEWSWVLSPDTAGAPLIGITNSELHLNPFFDIPEGRHYVVLSVNRTDQTATGYVDGVQVTARPLDPAWSFRTPTGYEHARFLMFSGEDDPTRGALRGSPAGTHLDAVRVQTVALTPTEVSQNWDDICAGKGANPPDIVDGGFRRGDSDTSGEVNLTDAIRILNVLFLGIGEILCLDAADSDDSGDVNLTDAIRVLNVLFLGIGEIGPPGTTTCGPDPSADAIVCASYPADC